MATRLDTVARWPAWTSSIAGERRSYVGTIGARVCDMGTARFPAVVGQTEMKTILRAACWRLQQPVTREVACS